MRENSCKLCVMESVYWVCRCEGSSNVQPILSSGALALVLDLTGAVTLVSEARIGECVGPYRAIASSVLDPSLVGFMARIAGALARASVPLMAYSSFERDYILVPAEHLDRAIAALREAGFSVEENCEKLA